MGEPFSVRLVEVDGWTIALSGDPVRAWQSTDGLETHEELTVPAPFPPRTGFYATELQGSLLVFGGQVRPSLLASDCARCPVAVAFAGSRRDRHAVP